MAVITAVNENGPTEERELPVAKAAQRPDRTGLLLRLPGQLFGLLYFVVDRLFGIASLTLLLAMMAAVPILNLWTLGAMLKSQGILACRGGWRQAFPLYAPAQQIGRMFLGMTIFLLPLHYLGSFTTDAVLINPNSTATLVLQRVSVVLAVLVFFHLLFSLGRGGKLRYFFQPWKNISWLRDQWKKGFDWTGHSAAISEFFGKLEVWSNWKAGFVAAAGVLLWTFLPTTLYAVSDSAEGPLVLITIIGGSLLAVVLSWVPVLQTGYAATGEWKQFLSLRQARYLFRQAPFLWTLTLFLGYGLSLILYLFKIVAPPQDALFLMTPIFIAIIYPVRLLTGWVFCWSVNRSKLPWWGWRWFWSLSCLLMCAFYVLLIFFTRNIGANGKLVLYEQPFLLIPSPF